MKGYVESLRSDHVKGWAFEKERPDASPRVRVLLDGVPVAEGIAATDRPDVAKVMGVEVAKCGFRLPLGVPENSLGQLVVQAAIDETWVDLPLLKPRRSYQDFGEGGDSKSVQKLDALHLEALNFGGPAGVEPLRGKSVLDLGCNEGFFCAEALRQGATRVLGVEANAETVERARKRVPEAEFLHGSWWDLPNEKFDVILFLSAIHYERRQKELLDKLATHLTNDGVLVLECGVRGGPGKKQWHVVPRWDGPKRYPSLDLLRQELLAKYGVRWIGPSVNQSGDPVPRYVFHCKPRRSVAMVIAGPSYAGKTALAHELVDRGIPHYDSDTALAKLLIHDEYAKLPFAQKLLDEFGKGGGKNLALVGQFVVGAGLIEDFVALVLEEMPVEAELFTIEGEIFRHAEVQKVLFDRLGRAGVRAWLVERRS